MSVNTETHNETAEAILTLADSMEKIANAFYNHIIEVAREKKSDPLRFDVVSVQPGDGFKLLLVILSDSREFSIRFHPILSWVTKNMHYTSEDEVRVTPMLFCDETEEILELHHFLSHARGIYHYQILVPGVNELDKNELEEIKSNLTARRKIQNDQIRQRNAEIETAYDEERT